MSAADTNKKPWQAAGQGFKKIAGALVAVGAPILANATLGPLGGQIVGQIVQNLGLGPEASETEIEKAIVAANPEILVEIRRIELQMIEAQHSVLMNREDNDTRRIEAVNEAIKAEVIGNPCAGAWRPLWGRWSCYGFWISLYTLIILTVVDVIAFGGASLVPHLPIILGALTGVFILPASILGVASYHRGIEKRVLAGEVRIPSATATPRDGIPRATPVGPIFRNSD